MGLSPRPILLNVADAADLLGVSEHTVYRMILRRELPSVHVGRAVRVPQRQLMEWIENRIEGKRTPAFPRM